MADEKETYVPPLNVVQPFDMAPIKLTEEESTLFGIPIRTDPTIPRDEIRLEDEAGNVVQTINTTTGSVSSPLEDEIQSVAEYWRLNPLSETHATMQHVPREVLLAARYGLHLKQKALEDKRKDPARLNMCCAMLSLSALETALDIMDRNGGKVTIESAAIPVSGSTFLYIHEEFRYANVREQVMDEISHAIKVNDTEKLAEFCERIGVPLAALKPFPEQAPLDKCCWCDSTNITTPSPVMYLCIDCGKYSRFVEHVEGLSLYEKFEMPTVRAQEPTK